MTRPPLIVALLAVAVCVCIGGQKAGATVHQIDIGNFFFSPTGTVVQPGDTVRWILQSGFHSTTSDAASPKAWNSGTMSTTGQSFDVVFTAADGPGPFPYHCSVHPTTMKDTIYMATATTHQGVADYVRDNVLGGSYDNVTMWMTETWLDPTHVVRDADPARPDIPFPYVRTWFVMVDSLPDANWGHKCLWLFVDDDLSQHQVIGTRDFIPAVVSDIGTGPLVPLRCRGVTPYPCPDLDIIPSTGDVGGEDKDCLYAVLISGGWNDDYNYSRYPQNLTSMYNILRGCGYPKANIFVYYADGTEPLDMDNADGDGSHATGSDVTAGAVEATIRAKISGLCATLDPDRDILFIYVTNHGESGGCAVLWDFDSDGNIDGNEKYCPSELSADIEDCQVCRLFMIHDQCYSGAFVDAIAASADHANVVAYSAATEAEPSWGREYMDIWEDNDPSTTDINDMHNDVVTTGITSTPKKEEKTAGYGDHSLCECCETCASGDCSLEYTATFIPPGTAIWPLVVEFQPPEPCSPSARCAPVDRFTLRDDELGLFITSLHAPPDPISEFYLVSQQPGGDPFFPAIVVGSLYVKAYLPDFGMQLHNTEAMVVRSENSFMQWPPPVGQTMTFMSIGRTHLVANFGRQGDTLTIENSFALLTNFQETSCCDIDGIRGDADNDCTFGCVTVADLSYLVEYLFQEGPAPACEDEGNADGDCTFGCITVADLSHLVAFLFQNGSPPPPCP